MLEIDLHSHTYNSACGNHSVLEMLHFAKTKGIKYLAITDHGPALGKRITSTFYERLQNPYEGITLLKGMECNVISDDGTIDVPLEFLPFMDIIIVGLHFNTPMGLGADYYTDLLIKTIKKNPRLLAITHPNDPKYPVHFEKLALAAKENNIFLELNNSKLMYDHVEKETTKSLLQALKNQNHPFLINSDAHSVHELGRDEEAMKLIAEYEIPRELILSHRPQELLKIIKDKRRC